MGWAFYQIGASEESLAYAERVLAMPDAPSSEGARGLRLKAIIVSDEGRHEEEVALYDELLALSDIEVFDRSGAMQNKAIYFLNR